MVIKKNIIDYEVNYYIIMSVVNHFEISLICLLHCMYYDITTNNKLIVFGGTLIGQFQVYNLIIQS